MSSAVEHSEVAARIAQTYAGADLVCVRRAGAEVGRSDWYALARRRDGRYLTAYVDLATWRLRRPRSFDTQYLAERDLGNRQGEDSRRDPYNLADIMARTHTLPPVSRVPIQRATAVADLAVCRAYHPPVPTARRRRVLDETGSALLALLPAPLALAVAGLVAAAALHLT